MNDEKKMKGLQITVMLITVILMCITVSLQVWAFQVLVHSILCSCVLLLLSVILVIDGILKDGKRMTTHGIWYALWFFNLIMNFFKF